MRRQSSISFVGIDSGTPSNQKLCGKYLQTFAYVTIKDRLPVILTKIVDHLSRDKEEIISNYGKDAEEDIKTIIGKISKLKNEVQTNKPLIDIESDGDDVRDWNEYLASQSGDEPVCWYQSPWLYTENYLYRRLREMFENSQALKDFDPFRKQKEEAFTAAVQDLKPVSEKALKNNPDVSTKFIDAIKTSLWSNRCDLSLSNGVVETNQESLFNNINLLDQFIICDDSSKILPAVNNHPSKIIDIIHDNASYELFCDLCLADQLLSTNLATVVRLRVKRMPWYVSDVTRQDIGLLFEQMKQVDLGSLAARWQEFIENGKFVLTEDKYWTLPFPYSEMQTRDPALYSSISEAALVIFKGDLNYRKLLGDINWTFSVPFKTALQGFLPTNVLALRTVKADLVCGLKTGRTEELFQKEPLWMRTGEYGVIQFASLQEGRQ